MCVCKRFFCPFSHILLCITKSSKCDCCLYVFSFVGLFMCITWSVTKHVGWERTYVHKKLMKFGDGGILSVGFIMLFFIGEINCGRLFTVLYLAVNFFGHIYLFEATYSEKTNEQTKCCLLCMFCYNSRLFFCNPKNIYSVPLKSM